jgi:hypothetical protein
MEGGAKGGRRPQFHVTIQGGKVGRSGHFNAAPVVNHTYRAAKRVWGRDQEESGLPLSRRLSVA